MKYRTFFFHSLPSKCAVYFTFMALSYRLATLQVLNSCMLLLVVTVLTAKGYIVLQAVQWNIT